LSRKLKKIGILGGTFDPCHKGHLKISKEAKKKFKLSKVIWAVTKKNPFKRKSSYNLEERLKNSKNLTKKYKFIQVNYYENIIKSNKTINLIKYLNKKYNNSKLYLIMGADNLIHFHKWSKWRNISSRCDIIVFDRYPYKSKALKSLAFKQIDRQKLKFINFKKVNISSSQLRKI
tara:strand:+ start:3539 stop:4063 length:525 start_codon:yes stop_codon:yes gene_type:complete